VAYQALLETFVADLRQRVVLYRNPARSLGRSTTTCSTSFPHGNQQNYYDPETAISIAFWIGARATQSAFACSTS